jgi:hypothetical protein
MGFLGRRTFATAIPLLLPRTQVWVKNVDASSSLSKWDAAVASAATVLVWVVAAGADAAISVALACALPLRRRSSCIRLNSSWMTRSLSAQLNEAMSVSLTSFHVAGFGKLRSVGKRSVCVASELGDDAAPHSAAAVSGDDLRCADSLPVSFPPL